MIIYLNDHDGTIEDVKEALKQYALSFETTSEQHDRIEKVYNSIVEQQ